jgi:Domain of unknown function (DUF4279)
LIRIFDADGNEVTPPPRPVEDRDYVCEIGGTFDETSVTLSVYSEDLDRDYVTKALGVQPTKAWNAGERHPIGTGSSGRTRIVDYGKWYLSTEHDGGPIGQKFRDMLSACTKDLDTWRRLNARYKVWFTVTGHLSNWNRELDIPSDVLGLLAERGLQLTVDVFFWGEDGNESEGAAEAGSQ